MTAPQHPYGQTGRHRAPVTPRPHLRRLVATVGLCMVAGLAILGATLGAHPTVPTVQAASPLQVAPIGPGSGRPRLLPGTVAVEAVGMREPAPANHPTGPPSATTTAASTTTAATATTDTTVPATTSTPSTTSSTAPTATPEGTPDPTPTTTETPMPTTSSVATCKAVTK